MDWVLSRGVVDRPGVRWGVGMRGAGGGSRGATSLSAGLVDRCLVRLICEGWLPQDPCSSPGLQSRSGRHPAVVAQVAHSPVAGPWSGEVVGLRGCSCRPDSRQGRKSSRSLSVQGRGLPAEGGELACAGDRDGPGWLAALLAEMDPALVKAALGAPGDLHDPGVLAALA